MPLSNPITERQIPQAIARDVETAAAMAAHLNAIDPHLQYATQARADERYGAFKKILYTGTTPATQGEILGVGTLLLDSFKIMGLSGVVQHSPDGKLVASGHTYSPGYEFSLSTSGGTSGTVIYIGMVPNRSANILSKPFRILVEYSLS